MASTLNYGRVEIFEEDTLGVGSYGKVCKAKCGQLPCAAKLLHQTMFQFGDPGVNEFTRRFIQEGQFLSSIKHPNIVQYLATVQDPKSGRPVLLMELMEESLTKFLKGLSERGTSPPPYYIQLNICYDVALALSYLHTNHIIHRDLSSNNVLLMDGGKRAKVTDFGMSRLMDMNPRMTPLTQCPGMAACMPPETLTDSPHYSDKMDCFSWGVLAVQVMTGNFPDPTDARSFHEDSRFPTGRVIVLVPEVERRKKDIDLIEAGHPLQLEALQCLKDKDTERPSADELCERLAVLKGEEGYLESVQQEQSQASRIVRLEQEVEAKGSEIEAKEREVQVKDSEVQEIQRELDEKEEEVQIKDRELQEKDRAIAAYHQQQQVIEKEIEACRRQLEEKEREVQTKDNEVQEMQRELEVKQIYVLLKDRQLLAKAREVQVKDRELQAKVREVAALEEKQLVIRTKDIEIKASHRQLEKDILAKEETIEVIKKQVKLKEKWIQSADVETKRLNKELEKTKQELEKMKQEVLDKVKLCDTKFEELVARHKVEREERQRDIKAEIESTLNHSKQQLLAAIQLIQEDHQSLEKLVVEERVLFDQSIDTYQAEAKQEMESLQKELVAVTGYKTEVGDPSTHLAETRPDYKTQKTEIHAALQQSLKEGDTWYLVDVNWMKNWKKYVGYDKIDQKLESTDPGPLDNSNLFEDIHNGTLKEYLIKEEDYYLLPESAWHKLRTWYGITAGSQPIPRKVVEYKNMHCKVEVYLLELKLCLYSNQDEIVVKQFSRADTVAHLESEMRRAFSIAADEECKVRCHFSTYILLCTGDSSRTLQDAGLYGGEIVTLEVRNKERAWLRDTESQEIPVEGEAEGGAEDGAAEGVRKVRALCAIIGCLHQGYKELKNLCPDCYREHYDPDFNNPEAFPLIYW